MTSATGTGEATGLVVRATPHRSSTYLDIAAGDGIHTVRVDALPDRAAARECCAGMRHLTSLRIDVCGQQVQCILRGVGHRTPMERPVPVAAALGLVRSGITTMAVDRTPAEVP